jgi:Nucleotidyl transferase AbiEii toxin, Type IV TA system
LERQVAEKLHAYTRTYKSGGTTRARDLVDLLLVLQHERVDTVSLKDAIHRVFDQRATHTVPERLPPPPRELAVSYRREAERVGLATNLDDVHHLLGAWLDPVLADIAHADVDRREKRES